MKKSMAFLISLLMLLSFTACSQKGESSFLSSSAPVSSSPQASGVPDSEPLSVNAPDILFW
ncbi:hypothetical protein LQE92_09730 [Lacrimispora sp. NSJ-141]|uniref:Lipoprotein n=1 Tax=Lientehia hominis TaxID=2897778 RepID=A0AAP2RJN9_9FIRM|nr:hypothetical protein [Lientehia hominis]MCD2492906.1 hypothetical protein [Lientehia hominis]